MFMVKCKLSMGFQTSVQFYAFNGLLMWRKISVKQKPHFMPVAYQHEVADTEKYNMLICPMA